MLNIAMSLVDHIYVRTVGTVAQQAQQASTSVHFTSRIRLGLSARRLRGQEEQ